MSSLAPHALERALGGSDPALRALFRGALALSLVFGSTIVMLDAGLRCETAPLGIISFEIAGASAQAMLDGWSEAQRRDALLIQGLDYLFLLVYSLAIASGALLVRRPIAERAPRLAALGGPAASAALLAGLLDAVENTPMTMALRSGVADPALSIVSLVSASLKGLLLVAALSFVVVALTARLVMARSLVTQSGPEG